MCVRVTNCRSLELSAVEFFPLNTFFFFLDPKHLFPTNAKGSPEVSALILGPLARPFPGATRRAGLRRLFVSGWETTFPRRHTNKRPNYFPGCPTSRTSAKPSSLGGRRLRAKMATGTGSKYRRCFAGKAFVEPRPGPGFPSRARGSPRCS